MPHDYHVNIVGYHLDGVLQRLTFALACVGGIGESDDLGAEPVDRGFEAQACPCRGLEEKASDDLPLEEFLLFVLFELLGCLQDVQDFFFAEILDRNQAFSHICIIALPQGRFYSINTASQPSVSLILLRKSSSWERRTGVSMLHSMSNFWFFCSRPRSLNTFITLFILR